MDTALPQKFPFILDRNLAKANCTGNRVCTSCDTVVLGLGKISLTSPKYHEKNLRMNGNHNFKKKILVSFQRKLFICIYIF